MSDQDPVERFGASNAYEASLCYSCGYERPNHYWNCSSREQVELRQKKAQEKADRDRIALKVTLAGFWIGLWIAALALSLWGIVYLLSHPQTDYAWQFWFWFGLGGPVALLVLRCWKWVLTLCVLALVGNWIHKHSKTWQLIAGVGLGWAASKPENQRRAGAYWAWLVKKPEGPGALTKADRLCLRVACGLGITLYSLIVLSNFPPLRPLSNAPVIPEPTPPSLSTHWWSEDPSYSQNTPVIHHASVETTPAPEPEVRLAYPVDLALHQEPDGRWYPDETLGDINRRKDAEARAHTEASRGKTKRHQ